MFEEFKNLCILKYNYENLSLIEYEYSIFLKIFETLNEKEKKVIKDYLSNFKEKKYFKTNLGSAINAIKTACNNNNITIEEFENIIKKFETNGIFIC